MTGTYYQKTVRLRLDGIADTYILPATVVRHRSPVVITGDLINSSLLPVFKHPSIL